MEIQVVLTRRETAWSRRRWYNSTHARWPWCKSTVFCPLTRSPSISSSWASSSDGPPHHHHHHHHLLHHPSRRRFPRFHHSQHSSRTPRRDPSQIPLGNPRRCSHRPRLRYH